MILFVYSWASALEKKLKVNNDIKNCGANWLMTRAALCFQCVVNYSGRKDFSCMAVFDLTESHSTGIRGLRFHQCEL